MKCLKIKNWTSFYLDLVDEVHICKEFQDEIFSRAISSYTLNSGLWTIKSVSIFPALIDSKIFRFLRLFISTVLRDLSPSLTKCKQKDTCTYIVGSCSIFEVNRGVLVILYSYSRLCSKDLWIHGPTFAMFYK